MSTATRVHVLRLVREAMAGVTQKSSRSTLTIIGTALGIGSFIAVLGVTSSANGQISQEFADIAATQITVQPVASSGSASQSFPEYAESAVDAIQGVRATAISWDVAVDTLGALATAGTSSGASVPRVLAASPGYWATVGASLYSGRFYDAFLADKPVAVIGFPIAKQLHIEDVADQPVIFVDGIPITVIGIVDNAARSSSSLTAVVVPDAFAKSAFGEPGIGATMTIDTDRGASEVVADQAALAIDPKHPEAYRVSAPPPASVVRDRISSSTQGLFFALATIGVLVGAVGIANSSLISVMSRIPEIGLRRSLGALPRHIAAQFLIEAAVRGLLGGGIGASVGIVAVAVVALSQTWTAVVEPWSIVAGPVLGTLIGLAAGLYPAKRASRIEPVEAFRQ